MNTPNPFAAAVILSAFIMGLGGIASAQKDKSPAIPVDEGNFVESMSDIYFGQVVDAVGTNVIQHNRATADIKTQGIIRENRDTLYSKVVIDARDGFRLTLPAAGKTYMAALILNHNTGLVREAKDQGDVGTYMAHSDRPRVIEITREAAGTDFVYILFRTQTDNSAEGNAAGAKLQDAIKLEIHGDPKDWKPQNFDTQQRDKLADLYKSHLAEYVARGAHFGFQEDSVVKEGGEKAADVRRHYAAFGWGGQLERYATYLTTPVIKARMAPQSPSRSPPSKCAKISMDSGAIPSTTPGDGSRPRTISSTTRVQCLILMARSPSAWEPRKTAAPMSTAWTCPREASRS